MNIFQKLLAYILADVKITDIFAAWVSHFNLMPDMNEWKDALTTRNRSCIEETSIQFGLAHQSEIAPEIDKPKLKFLSFFTYTFGLWMIVSKRSFSPSSELVNMLMHTDLPDFKIGEVKYVFEAFAIQLPEPIVEKDGTKHTLLFVVVEEDGFSVTSVDSPTFDGFTPMPEKEFDKLVKRAKDGESFAADRLHENMHNWWGDNDPIIKTFIFTASRDSTYEEGLRGHGDDKYYNGWANAYKLIVGLNLYLQTKRGDDIEKDIPYSPTRDHDSSLFEDIKQLELAVRPRKVGSGKTELCAPTGRTVSPHSRIGHWRRYKSSDIQDGHWFGWVRPCLILGSGSTFGGVIQKVESVN